MIIVISMDRLIMVVVIMVTVLVMMRMAVVAIVAGILHAFHDLFLHGIHIVHHRDDLLSRGIQDASTWLTHCSMAPPLQIRRSAFWIRRISAGVGSKEWLSCPAGITMERSTASPAICLVKS